MQQSKEIIETLAEQDGVNVAMLVSRDGFVLELAAARALDMEAETVGAIVSTYWASAEAMGRELKAAPVRSSIVELKDAVVATALLEQEDLVLTVVADSNTNLATMRYLTVKFAELLEALF